MERNGRQILGATFVAFARLAGKNYADKYQ